MIFGNAAHDTDIAPWALPDSLGGWGYADALAEAQQLMAGAGYPEGEGFEIVLMHNVSEGHARIAQAIQAMWLEAFPKAKFIVETMEWKVYLKAIQKESPLADMPHVFRLGWCLDYPDENNWLHEVMNPEEGANRFRLSYDDPYVVDTSTGKTVGDLIKEFSALTMQAGAEGDPDIRKALYKRAEKLASDEIAFYAPIYYYTRVVMIKPWLDRTFDDTNHWAKWSVDVAARGE
jgi:oligopeptide transport system substrate-binding protein